LDLDLDSIGAIGRNDENDVIAESKVLFDLLPRVVFAFRVDDAADVRLRAFGA
jgi:hypothetical protein